MTATPKQPTRERGERTTLPISEALPSLLEERGLSVTALAGLLEIKQSHLSRALRSVDGKKFSGELAERIAATLGLTDDYFVETREARVIQRLSSNPRLVDRIYDGLLR
jgi:transcriptional regulator with XRE-family HTH domain